MSFSEAEDFCLEKKYWNRRTVVGVVAVANPRIVGSGLWTLVAVVVERTATTTCLFVVVVEKKWRDVSTEWRCSCCCCCYP
jgi:hypothetical protein